MQCTAVHRVRGLDELRLLGQDWLNDSRPRKCAPRTVQRVTCNLIFTLIRMSAGTGHMRLTTHRTQVGPRLYPDTPVGNRDRDRLRKDRYSPLSLSGSKVGETRSRSQRSRSSIFASPLELRLRLTPANRRVFPSGALSASHSPPHSAQQTPDACKIAAMCNRQSVPCFALCVRWDTALLSVFALWLRR